MSPSSTLSKNNNILDMGSHISVCSSSQKPHQQQQQQRQQPLPFQGSMEQCQALEQIETEFQVTTDLMRAIVKQFVQEMQKGLDRHGATVAMIPSFVSGRPSGQEKGKYLALDLGGTNLRVCQVELLGNGDYSLHQQKYVVSDQLKMGDMRHLCDFIADCVDDFISEHGDPHAPLDLGFTFSFPILQTSINSGELKQWTKGFACANAVRKDPAVLLQDAFHRKNLQVNIAAIVNDTVGTLMAHAYRHPETIMGVILGTGSNTCYYEDIARIKKDFNHGKTLSDEMVVNMEWGAFDCERRILPLTIYDNKMNRESVNINQQLFEKMISGMYLGEIARNCMLYWIDRLMLFQGQSSPELNTQWRFETAYMSTIQADHSLELTATKHVLEDIMDLPAESTSLADRQLVQAICQSVGRRSARLAACGLAGILSHKNLVPSNDNNNNEQECGGGGDNDCLIAIDGSLFEFYPDFEKNMTIALVELFGEKISGRVRFELSRDGSGLGASVIAMMASKLANQ